MKYLLFITFLFNNAFASKSSKDMLDYAFYNQSELLDIQCEKIKVRPKYETEYKAKLAKDSIVGTLQLLGLERTIIAISEYAKLFEYSKGEFKLLYTNLINNECSKNLSVLSQKGLHSLFNKSFEKDNSSIIPSFRNSLDFQESVKAILQSKETKLNEFKNTVENFRAFCSWSHLESSYRLLAPYLSNPYIMTDVFNNILQVKPSWNHETNEVIIVPDQKTKRVVCKDSLCRKATNRSFVVNFPRMVGAVSLKDDLESLYCEEFRHKVLEKTKSKKINSLIKSKSEIQVKSEVMSYLSLVTQRPDILNGVNFTGELLNLYIENISSYWDKKASDELDQNSYSLSYEESLNVDLIPMTNEKKQSGQKLSLLFRYTVGEFDRMFDSLDKVDAHFNLEFDSSYISWFRQRYIFLKNRSKYAQIASIKKNLKDRVDIILSKKSTFFLTNLWNESMSDIIVEELSSQILYSKIKIDKTKNFKLQVPLKMEFGVFALKYFRNKYKANFIKESIFKKK